MKRAISCVTNLGFALIIGVYLCGNTACSKNTQNVTSAGAANPVTSPSPSQPLLKDCRLPKDEINKNASFIDDSANYAIYALLSNNAYERKNQHPFRLPAQEWREKEDFIREGTETGLQLKVYEKILDGKPDEIVIAFRGTDDRKDWWQNLAPQFLFPERRQTDMAERNFERLYGMYKGQRVRYVATGHSLGGGLALHLSFKYPDVAAVVFNSSPRVGLGRRGGRSNNDRVIVWESKEVLSYLRPLAKIRWGTVKEVKFNFQPGLKGEQHGMYALALNMLKLGSETSLPIATSLKSLLNENCQRL
ncbi:MAG: hypothetical protein ACREA2_06800 [Blastocatellia bacterium]